MSLRHILLIIFIGLVSEEVIASHDNLGDRDTRPLTVSKVYGGFEFSEEFKNSAGLHFVFDGLHVGMERVVPIYLIGENTLVGGSSLVEIPRFALLIKCLYHASKDAVTTRSRLTFLLLSAFIMHGLGDLNELITYPKTDMYVGICVVLTTLAIIRTMFMGDPANSNMVPAESNKGNARGRSKSSRRLK